MTASATPRDIGDFDPLEGVSGDDRDLLRDIVGLFPHLATEASLRAHGDSQSLSGNICNSLVQHFRDVVIVVTPWVSPDGKWSVSLRLRDGGPIYHLNHEWRL